MLITTKTMCLIMGRDRKQQADDIATGHLAYVPDGGSNLRLWSVDGEMAVELFFTDLRKEKYTVRIAGMLASRLHRAMTAYPDADRIALVTLENGNRFGLPADQVDLTSGFSSGVPVRETLIVEVRNLRARITRMIEAASLIIGDADDAD